MKSYFAIIYKLDNNYYAHWHNNDGDDCVESDPDVVYLESKIINEQGVTGVIFGYNYWND